MAVSETGPVQAVGSAPSGADPRRWLAHAAAALLAAVAIALLARAVLGPGQLGYDPAFALLWGRDLVHGHTGSLRVPIAPTPHPLANLVGVVLAPLGGAGAIRAMQALAWLAYGALGVAMFALGRRLAGPLTGVVATVLLLTRPQLAGGVLGGSLDVPFLALVVAAAAIATRGPGRAGLVLAVLIPAGLLRPEAWLLSLAWTAWCWREADAPPRGRMVALALAAPVLWALADLGVTGDPLFSFTGTRELAETLSRPRSFGSAVGSAGAAIADILGPAVFATGVAGLLLQLWRPSPRVLLVEAVGALGVLAFLAVGAAGLPVLTRYALMPATMLAAVAAWALTVWVADGRPGWRAAAPATRVGLVLAFVLALWCMADLAPTARRVGDWRTAVAEQRTALASLRQVVGRPDVRRDARRCGGLLLPGYRAVPYVALWLDARLPRDLAVTGDVPRGGGVAIVGRTVAATRASTLDPVLRPLRGAPAEWGFGGAAGDWAWFRRCRRVN